MNTAMRTSLVKKMMVVVLLIAIGTIAKGNDGKTLFKNNCAVCHSIGGGRVVGPDLKGVNDKRAEDWLIKFIIKSSEMIQEGDEDALAIFNEYNKIPMPDHPNLNDAQVKNILAYISEESNAQAEVVQVSMPDETPEVVGASAPIDLKDVFFSGSWQSNMLTFLVTSTFFLFVVTIFILFLTFQILGKFK
jgi:cytochrome c551/c552